ncbi:MAG: hypothetical protein OEM04_06660 [Flavobacteriaceae bacterium]|nr:hypothetical protein [Flavobacteriaceae bacterium]
MMSIKLFSVVFSSFILVQSFHIPLSDVIKLQGLYDHAQFHQKTYGDNIFIFLSKHYGPLKESHKSNHQKESQQLPFDHHSGSDYSTSYVWQIMKCTCVISVSILFQPSNFHYQETYASLVNSDIFQPPRSI